MLRRTLALASPLMLLMVASPAAMAADKLTALIVDGQNNHKWQETTPVLRRNLEECARFDVSVATSPGKGADLSRFQPPFADYDVVVLNYNGEPWAAATQKAFEKYVAGGGGVVVVHAANNSFPEWPAYNEIIGLGGWGGRDERSGPYVRWRDGKFDFDRSPGRGGSHGQQHVYQVVIRDSEHLITRGLPTAWMHPADELYDRLRGPARNLHVLATSFSATDTGGTGEHEPSLMTIEYGKGRVFHTTLGHSAAAMRCAGFITTLCRGAEWAATGEVTLDAVPADFPTADAVSERP